MLVCLLLAVQSIRLQREEGLSGKEYSNGTSNYPLQETPRRRAGNWWNSNILEINCENQPEEGETCDEDTLYCKGYCKPSCAKVGGLLLLVKNGENTEWQCVSCDSGKGLVSPYPSGLLTCSNTIMAQWDFEKRETCDNDEAKWGSLTGSPTADEKTQFCVKKCYLTEEGCTIEVATVTSTPKIDAPKSDFVDWEDEKEEDEDENNSQTTEMTPEQESEKLMQGKKLTACCPEPMEWASAWKPSIKRYVNVCHNVNVGASGEESNSMRRTTTSTPRMRRASGEKIEEMVARRADSDGKQQVDFTARTEFQAPQACRYTEEIYEIAA